MPATGQVDGHSEHHHNAGAAEAPVDRKSTRLNSSHSSISYAVLRLKKKKARVHGLHHVQGHTAGDLPLHDTVRPHPQRGAHSATERDLALPLLQLRTSRQPSNAAPR